MSEGLTKLYQLTYEVPREAVVRYLEVRIAQWKRALVLWESTVTDEAYMRQQELNNEKNRQQQAQKEGIPLEVLTKTTRLHLEALAKSNAAKCGESVRQWEARLQYLANEKSFTLVDQTLVDLVSDISDKFPPLWESLEAAKRPAN